MHEKSTEVYSKLDSAKVYFKDAVSKWNEINPDLTTEEKIDLIRIFCQKNIFRWLYLISDLFPQIADELTDSSEDFLKITKVVIDKIKNDMAQGIFIKSLIKIGENNLGIGKYIYNNLSKIDEYAVYAGFIMGGMIKSDPNKIRDFIEIDENDINIKIIAIVSLSTAFKEMEDLGEYRKLTLEFIQRFSDSNENPKVKQMAVPLNFDFYKFFKKECFSNLLELATKNSDSTIRFRIINTLWIEGLDDIDKEFELVEACSGDRDLNVLNILMNYLAQKGYERPQRTFKVIMPLIKDGLDLKINSFHWALNEMGKKNISGIEQQLIDYVSRNPELDQATISLLSRAIVEIYRENEEQLRELIDRFDREGGHIKELADSILLNIG